MPSKRSGSTVQISGTARSGGRGSTAASLTKVKESAGGHRFKKKKKKKETEKKYDATRTPAARGRATDERVIPQRGEAEIIPRGEIVPNVKIGRVPGMPPADALGHATARVRKNINVDQALLDRARATTGAKSETETVNIGLQAATREAEFRQALLEGYEALAISDWFDEVDDEDIPSRAPRR